MGKYIFKQSKTVVFGINRKGDLAMIKGYSFDIDPGTIEVDTSRLEEIIRKALEAEGIELLGLAWQASWCNEKDYEYGIQCS